MIEESPVLIMSVLSLTGTPPLNVNRPRNDTETTEDMIGR
jgi:hypothetical protein